MCGDFIKDVGYDLKEMFTPRFGLPKWDFWNVDEPDNDKVVPYAIVPAGGDDIRHPVTRLDELVDKSYTRDQSNSNVTLEDFSQTTFEEVYRNMVAASPIIAPGYAQIWADISSAIIDATNTIDMALGKPSEQASSDSDSDDWRGQLHDAVIENIKSSFAEVKTAARGAEAMGYLVEAFANTIQATKQNIVSNWDRYAADLRDSPEAHDRIKQGYDIFARQVMQEVYSKNIELIAKDNPVFSAGGPPPLGPEQTGLPSGPGSFGGGGRASFGGVTPASFGGGGPASFGGPDMSDFTGPTVPDVSDTTPIVPTGGSPVPATPPSGLNGPTAPASAAPGGAPNGIGQGAPSPTGLGKGGPPEGVLGLGPKGLGSPAGGAGGGAGGKTGAGIGAGGPRGLATGRTAGAPVQAAARLPGAGTAVGAGPGAMGPAGMGAPAAGQRGGDANGKGHQVIKALRRKKNGQEVVGDADAVVPVIGEPDNPDAAQPEAAQADQPDHFGSGVRSTPGHAPRADQPIPASHP